MLKEYSQVVLTKPLPSLRLEPVDVGVVVHVYDQGRAYEVDFLTLDGNTVGVETVGAADLRQPWAIQLFTSVSDWSPDFQNL